MAETIIAGTAVALDAGSHGAKSAASWPSIIAGAFVAAATTVVLVAAASSRPGGAPRMIRTVRGVGFQLAVPGER